MLPSVISPENTSCRYAVELYNLGCNVVPMRLGERGSFGSWTKKRNNRDDVLTLQRFFARNSDARPGIILDEQSRIVMVEGDGANSAEALAQFNLPETLTVQSRRGKHYFFRWPAECQWPKSSFYLVDVEGSEVEFKVNSLTPMPPQVHHADPSIVLTFVGLASIADAPPSLTDAVAAYHSHRDAGYDAAENTSDNAWARVLQELVDSGRLDHVVRWDGGWRDNGTRALFCPLSDEHAGREEQRSSAYLITRNGAGMRCDKPGHNFSVLQFIVRLGLAPTVQKAKQYLTNAGIAIPSLRTDVYEPGDRIELNAMDGDLDRITTDTINALCSRNVPERYFVMGSELTTVTRDENGTLSLRQHSKIGVTGILAREISWYKANAEGEKQSQYPPRQVAEYIADRDDLPLPAIGRITRVPIFRPDGSLHDQSGYDATTKAWYEPSVEIPAFPSTPNDAEVQSALAFVMDNVFVDFKFSRPRDKAHALALFLMPFVRSMIDGPTPLFDASAPDPGSGKGLLVSCALYPGLGEVAPTHYTEDDEEMGKLLLSKLLAGTSAILFDNVKGEFGGQAVEMALTSRTYTQRILGVNKIGTASNNAIWVMTANNASFSPDVARRRIPIRLTPGVENPDLIPASKFKHPSLETWVKENHGELIAAAFTIVRYWVNKGRVPGTKSFASFEPWARIVGGIIESVGVEGFLEDMLEERAISMSSGRDALLRKFLARLRLAFGDRAFSATQAVPIALACGMNVGRINATSSQAKVLGHALRKNRDAIRSGMFLAIDWNTARKVNEYRVGTNSDPESLAEVSAALAEAQREVNLEQQAGAMARSASYATNVDRDDAGDF